MTINQFIINDPIYMNFVLPLPIATDIKKKALEIGFHKVGITNIDDDHIKQNQDYLKNWLKKGYNAEMAWMENPKRTDIRQLMSEVKSVICVALNYYTPFEHSQNPEIGKISRYGWGRDYHRIISKKLKLLSEWLNNQNDAIKTKYCVDTAPIHDKVWAQKSGIGWIGKNGNLITKEYGSWVFLGEILINIPLTPDQPHSNHCGTCVRCLKACPTQAIVEPFVIDANKCIAYHTIENREENLPENITNNLQGWVAGCDICQDVCPWNQRFAQMTDIKEFFPYPHNIEPPLQDLANLSESEWDYRFRASALRRIKPQMWRRNASANLQSLPKKEL